MRFEQVTFFRPGEVSRERTTLPAGIYNHCRLLLARSPADCQFVPIRSMQYQGVITEDEVLFVDAQGYAVRDGQGGRMIVMAWEMVKEAGPRDSLTDPVPIDVVHYHHNPDDLRRRLLLEFGKAMNVMLERQQEAVEPQTLKVVPIRVNV